MSKGRFAGMAPEADIYAMKVLDHRGEGSVPDILRGVDWILKNWARCGIKIVNISVGARLGIEDDKGKELVDAVEELWNAGLVVVVSAGNYGPDEGSVAVPGTSRKIITVGSTDSFAMTGTENKTYYSGCGPTQECVVKPDVVAPGYQITSCNNLYYYKKHSPYTVKSGSSMATPVASGAIALLLSKYPEMKNIEVKLRLRGCSDREAGSMQYQGWGRINVQKLLAEKQP